MPVVCDDLSRLHCLSIALIHSSLVTSVNYIVPKPHVLEQLDAINLRLPLDRPRAAAPHYKQACGSRNEEEGRQRQRAVSLALQHDGRPSSSESQQSYSLGSVSVRAGPRLSIGSMGSVPSSACDEHAVRWCGQWPFYHNSTSQKSLSHSTTSEKMESPRHLHGNLAITYTKAQKGPGVLAGHEKDFAAQQEPFQTRIDKAENQDDQRADLNATKGEASLEVMSSVASRFNATSLPNGDLVDGAPNLAKDSESQMYEDVLHGRRRITLTRKLVKMASMVVAFLAFLALVLILHFHTNKKMARAAILACTTVAYFCAGAGMWAADRTMAETFIAMNLVVVYGIFVNGQVDVFLGYATTN